MASSIKLVEETYLANKENKKKLIAELKKLVKQGKAAGDSLLVGTAYYYIAFAYYCLDDRDKLFSNAIKAVALVKDTKEPELIVRAYVMLGYAYSRQENHQMELACYDKAYHIMKKHRIKGESLLSVLNNLSSCYHFLGDLNNAIKMLEECIALHKSEFPEGYSDCAMYCINLANYYSDLGDKDKAEAILAEMEGWLDKVDFKPLVCDYYLRRAILAYKKGNTASAKKLSDKAMKYIPKDIYPHPIYEDLRNVSHLLVECKDKKRAEKIVEQLKIYSEHNSGTIEQLIVARSLSEYYSAFGEKELAIEYYQKLEDLYEKRLKEFTQDQLNLHKIMSASDAEIQKLTKQVRMNEILSQREPLTGLLNRSALLSVASDFIDEAKSRKQKIGAIFIDIDYFKECNDTYGHAKGDEIIRKIADLCRKEENQIVRFARYGGDEFFGMTLGLSDEEVAEIAKRICDRLRKADIPNKNNPNGHRVTVSVGIANVTITPKTDTIIQIANYADKAVYYSKNAGKDAIYLLDHNRKDVKGKNNQFVKIEY